MKPYFSIIIPTREIGSMTINEALPTLKAQTFQSFEVLVIPDKIKLEEKKLPVTYPFLTLLNLPHKKKPGDKRDFGAEHAQGEVLVFIDDDVFPTAKWLEHVHHIFSKRKSVAALGGPGLLPLNTNMWEKIIDGMLKTWIGSGRYTYRFTPQQEQYVDDYPSMNLMIRTDIFRRIGGFDNQHWPGEDSKMLNKFRNKEHQFILYNPKVAVYHHRRQSLWSHMVQHKNYGSTRGKFAAQGDKNSTHLVYTVPALFMLYLLTFGLVAIALPSLIGLSILPLYAYGALMGTVFLHSFWDTESIILSIGSMLIVPLTHITYGVWFIVGYLREKIQHLK